MERTWPVPAIPVLDGYLIRRAYSLIAHLRSQASLVEISSLTVRSRRVARDMRSPHTPYQAVLNARETLYLLT